MDHIAVLPSTAIQDVILPTFKIFSPLLQSRSGAIKAITPTTHTYGSHPRQKLDIYEAASSPSSTGSPLSPAPILIFLYGGGLNRGDKILPTIPDGLAYHNVGTFFATQGFTTVIPDYRRVNNPVLGTGEDAVYDSGREDVIFVLSWLENSYLPTNYPSFASRDEPLDVFLLGNSAGGLHLSSFLLAPSASASSSHPNTPVSPYSSKKLHLAGAILMSVPFHFKNALPARIPTLNTYYGSSENIASLCPYGLLQSLQSKIKSLTAGSEAPHPQDFGIPPLLIIRCQRDPEDEILGPNRDFMTLWKEIFLTDSGIEEMQLRNHNHISPPLAFMSGDGDGEEWGREVVGWMKGLASRT